MSEDRDILRRERIALFMRFREEWYAHYTLEELLLEFEHFLMECEEKRQKA